jgi:AAA family ATP:ADP antiporter
MLSKRWALLKEEFGSYSKVERLFILAAMICGFLICAEYSTIRPAANSLFLHTFSVKVLPYAWIAMVPLNFLLVTLYSALLPKWGPRKVFFTTTLLIAGGNITFGILIPLFPKLSFALYIWKEIYILLMFQQLWSLIHATVNLKRARYLYGVIFGVGGLGSVFGSTLPTFFAVSIGSESLLFLSLPIYALLLFFYLKAARYCDADRLSNSLEPPTRGGLSHGIKLIASSRFLIFILLLVVFMQLTSTIVDFQFSDYLQSHVPEKDLRTAYAGKIMGLIHTLTVALQFMGSYFLIRFMGLRNTHFSIPIILGACALSFAFVPAFALLTLSFVAVKTLDFSLFGVLKEMLYIPLSTDEKFRAKAVIDIFAFRSSKAVASLGILGLQLILPNIHPVLTWILVVLTFLWCISIAYGMRHYQTLMQVEARS